MPSTLITNVLAGPYTATYAHPGQSSAPLGTISEGGVTEIREHSIEDIIGDQYGDIVLDGIYLGGNHFLEFSLEEANRNAVRGMAFPFGTFPLDNEAGLPGTLASSYAGELVLTPVAGTPSAAESFPVRTYGLVLLDNNHNVERSLQARHMVIPIRLRCYPYDDTGDTVWYTRGV